MPVDETRMIGDFREAMSVPAISMKSSVAPSDMPTSDTPIMQRSRGFGGIVMTFMHSECSFHAMVPFVLRAADRRTAGGHL